MIQALDYSQYFEFFILNLCYCFAFQHLINIPYFIFDTYLSQLKTWFFSAKCLMHLIIYQNQAFKTYTHPA